MGRWLKQLNQAEEAKQNQELEQILQGQRGIQRPTDADSDPTGQGDKPLPYRARANRPDRDCSPGPQQDQRQGKRTEVDQVEYETGRLQKNAAVAAPDGYPTQGKEKGNENETVNIRMEAEASRVGHTGRYYIS